MGTALLPVALSASVALAACGSSDGEGAADREGGDPRATLTIKDFRFAPDPLAVPVGARVNVTNEDDAAHTATADDASFDSGNIAGKASKKLTFSEAGEFAYKCSIHDYMRGVIRVGG